MNIINSTPRRVARQRKELWSWNKNQDVALEQMKAATMVLNMLDYAMVYIPSFFRDILFLQLTATFYRIQYCTWDCHVQLKTKKGVVFCK